MDYVELELNASEHGWTCSGCGLFIDAMGRPVFGHELWKITSTGKSWIENKPEFVYCPKCGKPFKRGENRG
jgi:hypothetical protein